MGYASTHFFFFFSPKWTIILTHFFFYLHPDNKASHKPNVELIENDFSEFEIFVFERKHIIVVFFFFCLSSQHKMLKYYSLLSNHHMIHLR